MLIIDHTTGKITADVVSFSSVEQALDRLLEVLYTQGQ